MLWASLDWMADWLAGYMLCSRCRCRSWKQRNNLVFIGTSTYLLACTGRRADTTELCLPACLPTTTSTTSTHTSTYSWLLHLVLLCPNTLLCVVIFYFFFLSLSFLLASSSCSYSACSSLYIDRSWSSPKCHANVSLKTTKRPSIDQAHPSSTGRYPHHHYHFGQHTEVLPVPVLMPATTTSVPRNEQQHLHLW